MAQHDALVLMYFSTLLFWEIKAGLIRTYATISMRSLTDCKFLFLIIIKLLLLYLLF